MIFQQFLQRAVTELGTRHCHSLNLGTVPRKKNKRVAFNLVLRTEVGIFHRNFRRARAYHFDKKKQMLKTSQWAELFSVFFSRKGAGTIQTRTRLKALVNQPHTNHIPSSLGVTNQTQRQKESRKINAQ
jgi:hypothetical protein